ncbi:Ankyrin repeat [Fusarium albosuccineum]|uniref:Ankyrin repeat n=1 Tax=Fusarium albosuccineum TaxID=1237068 RepID=A0A8H4L4M7_9HYPO|nr:Ankyrin repeat [Fusarium albosuccineum]
MSLPVSHPSNLTNTTPFKGETPPLLNREIVSWNACQPGDDDQPHESEPGVEAYTVGWICALNEEFQAACHMVENERPGPLGLADDENQYVVGQIGGHHIVIGCLPMGRTGTTSAAVVARDMSRSFPNLKFALMVGIGGGAPNLRKKRDIRLGDVVVSIPDKQQPGVVQMDFGKRHPNGLFERRGHLNSPPTNLLAACQLVKLSHDNMSQPDKIAAHIARMENMEDYRRPALDRLYLSDHLHHEEEDTRQPNDVNEEEAEEDRCRGCGDQQVAKRKVRNGKREVYVHYGTIASDNVVMADAIARDKHSSDNQLNILCFEMEAAGLMNNLRCLVIRGICDYADSHKNDEWHNYAALAAAAYARELLLTLRPTVVADMPSWVEDIHRTQRKLAMDESQKAAEDRAAGLLWKTRKQLEKLRDRIEARGGLSEEIYSNARRTRHQDTCTWLFKRPEFIKWTAENPEHPILWLNGKHGAGKTWLCAAAIDHVLKAPRGPDKPPPAVAWRFFAADDPVSRGELLQRLATQLLSYLIDIPRDAVPDTIEPFLTTGKEDLVKLENLILATLHELPHTYIFVDGLDEDSNTGAQYPATTSGIPDFVKFLVQTARAPAHRSKVRIWCSSQPPPYIREYLCSSPYEQDLYEIQLRTEDTEQDMLNYLVSELPASMSDKSLFAGIFVSAALTTEVEGSFLWVSTMLEELKNRAEDSSDLIALAKKGLPTKMSNLYHSIIKRIEKLDGGIKTPPLWKVSESKILDSCISLVRCNSLTRRGRNFRVIRLSHSAVRTFLLENSETTSASGDKGLVSSGMIRDCCLRYLSQPRYAKLLHKDETSRFFTHDNQDIRLHELLLYAAKYWFQYFDLPDQTVGTGPLALKPKDPTREQKDQVLEFLHSSHFQTCLQVQSLYVVGHFLQRFDPITDQGMSIRRTLPNWLPRCEPTIHRQYLNFQGEWSQLLQSGQLEPFSGEIDRCLWGALGPYNFLSRSETRYTSFEFSRTDAEAWVNEDGCQVQQPSKDGLELLIGWVKRQGSRSASPFRSTSRRIGLKSRKSGISIEIGFGDSTDTSSGYSSNSESDSSRSWSDSKSLPDLSSAEESWSEGSTSTDDPSSDEIASEGPTESGSDLTDPQLDFRSQESEDDSSDIQSAIGLQSQEFSDTGSDESLISLSQIIDSSSSASEDFGSGDDQFEDEVYQAEPATVNPEPDYPVEISRPRANISCDSCNRRHLRQWYHCTHCVDGDFDLCERCERRGIWCLDLSHGLYKVVNRKPMGMVVRRNFKAQQELTVYRMDAPQDERLVFRFKKKYPNMLHESPPIVHPQHSLVVWPLSGSNLLFADFKNNSFFEQKVKTTDLTADHVHFYLAHPICTNLSFSNDGLFLYVAIIDAVAEKPAAHTSETPGIIVGPKSQLCLNLHVLVLQLSSSKPTRNQPKLVAMTSCRLGCSCARAFTPTLPFAFTWGDNMLHLTLSDSCLHVYRITIPKVGEVKDKTKDSDTARKENLKFTVLVPKEKILLPRSARNRSVQFFPAKEPDANNLVIIGPRYGNHPRPPCGVYLSEQQLGGWVIQSDEDTSRTPQKRLAGLLEEPWDDDTDCIIIPFDGY